MKAWNVNPGMLIRVGTLNGSDYRQVTDVEKQRCYFSRGSCWKIFFNEFGRTYWGLRFTEDNLDVRKALTMPVTVRRGLEEAHVRRALEGTTAVIERARGPSYFGEIGEPRNFWNVSTPSGRAPLAQGDTAEELRAWAFAHGARRVEVL